MILIGIIDGRSF